MEEQEKKMKKNKIVALLAAAAMTLAAGNAFASFSQGDLIQVVVNSDSTVETATDLGSITSLESASNLTVSNVLNADNANQNVFYFAATNSTHTVSVGAVAPITTYTKETSGSSATGLSVTVIPYYNTLTAANNAYGYSVVTANNTNTSSYNVFANAAGTGSVAALLNIANQANAYSSLASLATTPINETVYTFTNIEQNKSGSNLTTPGVAIEIASNGNVIINASQAAPTPIPAAAYLLGSGLLGLLGFRRKNA
jgi:hypothetical protein